jgi:RNA methyltransferase, TrmH family
VISNPNNPTIRKIRKLRKRRERDRVREMIVEGHRALAVAITTGAGVSRVLHTREATARRSDLLRDARSAGATVLEVTQAVMASLTSVETAPDILGVAPMRTATLDEAVSKLGLGAILAEVHDPATAGSILSSCAAAGGTVAIAARGTTDLFAPKPVRSAAGAHFVLTIAPDVEPDACASALGAAGTRIAVLDPAGRDPAEVRLDEPLAVVVGEDGAVPERLIRAAAEHVGVGGDGSAIRPSVSAQAAVVLFEAARRRRASDDREPGRG